MQEKIRFGIIAAGRISESFATGLESVGEARLEAVASRNIQKAKAFATRFKAGHAYGSYLELAQDPDIDVVYIGSPNSLHREHSLLCLEHGKAVICEKPFASNQREAQEMVDLARKKGLFLMEAMWTRYIPMIQKIRGWVAEGRIGRVKLIKGDFGYKSDSAYTDIRFKPELAGGALLDVGIYPISFASMIFNQAPQSIDALTDIGPHGVDEQTSMLFGYPGGEMAQLSCAIMTGMPNEMSIIGEEGYIHLPRAWYAQEAKLHLPGQEAISLEIPIVGNGYNYEAAEVVTCLRAGRQESENMPLDESLALMATLDRVRKKIGLVFPGID